MRKRLVVVNDSMQRDYRYERIARTDCNFDLELTPRQMLRLGVFCGKYMTDGCGEFPGSWFAGARLASGRRDCSLNLFGVDASQKLSVWRAKGWIHPDDPRGWFQWYCRYYMGRRIGARSGAGRRCAGTSARSSATANPATRAAVRVSDRPCFTGPMTAAGSDALVMPAIQNPP
jgi:hypothetical protein